MIDPEPDAVNTIVSVGQIVFGVPEIEAVFEVTETADVVAEAVQPNELLATTVNVVLGALGTAPVGF